MRGATRRRHADSQLLMLQNPHRHQCRARCRGRGPGWGTGGWRKPDNCTHGRCHDETNLAQQEPRRAASVQNFPSTPLAPHVRDKTLPARAARPHFRYKTLPARPFPPHVRYKTLPARAARPYYRYKTLPAHPLTPHVRYKTLPARPKWLNLALFLHAGRVLYRSHHQEAEQGEFCTEREAETGLANTTAHQAPPVWRAAAGPGPDKFRMQFKNTSDTTSQTDTN